MMRDDTKRIACDLLWRELEKRPMGTPNDMVELARVCEGVVEGPNGEFELVGRGALHDVLDLDDLESMLMDRAEDSGAYVEYRRDGLFALRRRRGLDSLNLSGMTSLTYSYTMFMDIKEWVNITVCGDRLEYSFGHSKRCRRIEDREELEWRLGRALDDGGVARWAASYSPENGVLDGYSWGLELLFDDGTAFASGGDNAVPEGFSGFYEGLLVALLAS